MHGAGRSGRRDPRDAWDVTYYLVLMIHLHALFSRWALSDRHSLDRDPFLRFARTGRHLDIFADDQTPDALLCPGRGASAELVVPGLDTALVLRLSASGYQRGQYRVQAGVNREDGISIIGRRAVSSCSRLSDCGSERGYGEGAADEECRGMRGTVKFALAQPAPQYSIEYQQSGNRR